MFVGKKIVFDFGFFETDVGSDELNEENDEDEKLYEYEYASESKNVENVSKIQSKTQKT